MLKMGFDNWVAVERLKDGFRVSVEMGELTLTYWRRDPSGQWLKGTTKTIDSRKLFELFEMSGDGW